MKLKVSESMLHKMKKYFKKIKMSKTFIKWFLSICLVFIICMNLKIYMTKGEINIASLVAVLALLPISLKSLEYKISKKIMNLMEIISATLVVGYFIWASM